MIDDPETNSLLFDDLEECNEISDKRLHELTDTILSQTSPLSANSENASPNKIQLSKHINNSV
jgi:hypothetical protein